MQSFFAFPVLFKILNQLAPQVKKIYLFIKNQHIYVDKKIHTLLILLFV